MGLWGHSTVPSLSWCQFVNYAPTYRKLVNTAGCIFGHGCLDVDKLLPQHVHWFLIRSNPNGPDPLLPPKKMAVAIIPSLRPENHSQQTSGCCRCGSIYDGFVHLSIMSKCEPNQDGEWKSSRCSAERLALPFVSGPLELEKAARDELRTNWECLFLLYRKWKSPLLHGLSVFPALHDLLDDVRLHLLWVGNPLFRSFSFPLFTLSPPSLFPLPPSDWRIHCSTSYAKDGFWLYLTQIASCSPWMFWMFLNSIFHFMWVAVLIMCQLYQVWNYIWHTAFK